MGFPRRLLGDDETLLLLLRRHVVVLVVPLLVLVGLVLVVGAGVLLAPGGSVEPWLRLAIVVLGLLIAARWVFWPILVWRNTMYAVTTRRLVIREGVLNRSGHDMPLSRLNDVSFRHTVWQRILGCGTLVVESAGERGQLELDLIPKVELVQRTLYRLSDDARGVTRPAGVDRGLATSLDTEFDDEYRGPTPET